MAQTSTSNDTENVTDDHSLLMKPINIGCTGIKHIVQSLQNGTAEVRNLLLNECSIIYECKVCRSLHRSLANFIAHKRVYCAKHCCETMLLFEQPDIEKETVIIQPESPDSGTIQEEDYLCEMVPSSSADVDAGNVSMEVGVFSPKILQPLLLEAKERIPAKYLAGNDTGGKEPFYDSCVKHLENRANNHSKLILRVKTVDSNHNAVFQVVQQSTSEEDSSVVDDKKSKKEQKVEPVEEPLEQKPALQDPSVADAKLKKKKKNDDSYCCTCFKCGAKFTSVKTMTIHLRSIHAKKRVYFPCPYCSAMFSQSWGVVRHLLTIHKKTKEQVNKLRGKIRQKAWQRATADKDSGDEAGPPPTSDVKQLPKLPAFSLRSLQTGSPIVHIKKATALHKCHDCEKIFAQNDTLAKHRDVCHSRGAEPFTKLEPNTSRPKRVVKKKVIKDFVNSSRLTIRSNMVSKGENIKRAPPNIERKILSIIDTKKLECVQCRRTFTTLSNLRRHAATHVGWNRYKCKHCDYQSYSRSECRNHVKRVHIKKRQLQSQADKFIVDLPADEEQDAVPPRVESPHPPMPKPTEEQRTMIVVLPVGTKRTPVVPSSSENKPVTNKKPAIDALPTSKPSSPKKTSAVLPSTSKHVSKRKLTTVDVTTKPKSIPGKKVVVAEPSEPKPVFCRKPSAAGGESAEYKSAFCRKLPVAGNLDSRPPSIIKRLDVLPPELAKPSEFRMKLQAKKSGVAPSPPQTDSAKMSNGTVGKQSPVSVRKSPSNSPAPCNFNISTRLSPRTFDTSPYRPTPQVATLVTRSGTYVKSDPIASTKREENIADVQVRPLRKKSPRHVEQPRPTATAASNGTTYTNSSSSRLCDHNYSVELNRVIKQEPISDDSS